MDCVQPDGPYCLAGYSFGACIALEMALQLQQYNSDRPDIVQSLVLLDGSHLYVNAHTDSHRAKLTPGHRGQEETEAMCAFVQQFMSIDYNRVSSLKNDYKAFLALKLRSCGIGTHLQISLRVTKCTVVQINWIHGK